MDPLLNDFPNEIITDRLLLRIPKAGDGKEVNEAIRASVKELRPWLTFAQNVGTVEETEKDVRRAQSKFLLREYLRFHMYHKEDGYFIGSIELYNINWNIPKFEILYWIDTRLSGNGYMSEAAEAVTDFAFEKLEANRVQIKVASENKASMKLAEKLGFSFEGVLKNNDIDPEGKLLDMWMFAKTTKKEK